MSFAQRERQSSVHLMRQVGPDAPTLCGEWTTRDLAAHLIIRERRPDAALGILIPALADFTARVQDRVAGRDWEWILDEVASGPPIWSLLRWIDRYANALEMFAHHEDVRRGEPGWSPRDLSDDRAQLIGMLKLVARNYRGAPVGVELAVRGGPAFVARRSAGAGVRITGEPGELVLHAIGRSAVVVDFTGADDDIAAVNATPRGV